MMEALDSNRTEWIEDRLIGKRRIPAPRGLTVREYLVQLVSTSNGKCGVLDLPMRFDKESRTPVKGERGQHPLSVSLDHIAPQSDERGHRLICHFLNDVKNNLPPDLFDALVKTPEFQNRRDLLRYQNEVAPDDMEGLIFVWKHGRLPNGAEGSAGIQK